MTYKLTSDYFIKNFSQNTLTFSIEKIKSKTGVIAVKPILEFYDTSKDLVTSENGLFIVGASYRPYSFEFTLSQTDMEYIAYYRLILEIDGVTTENPLAFNHIQLSEGSVTDYHQPEQDLPKSTIRFANNFYANLYTSNDDSYLQVIRPYYTNMDTETLTKSKVTVLAPHLKNEDDIDDPSNIGLEFMNQTDQTIEILR